MSKFVSDINDFSTFLKDWTPPVKEIKPEPVPDVLKEGDILLANWGYEANNPHFFKVLKRTAKQATIMQLKNKTVSLTNDGMGGQMVMPTDEPQTFSVWRDNNYGANENAPVILKRKIHTNSYPNEFILLANYAAAYLWDGKPAHDYNWH
jgi:hypothetical protein